LLVEVKAYPSATYVRGPKEGQAKAGGAALQVRHYFAEGILSAMLLRDDRPEALVVLPFPDMETYRTLARRTHDPLHAAGRRLWMVAEHGSVSQVEQRDQETTADTPLRTPR
jgi:hypothetical protein